MKTLSEYFQTSSAYWGEDSHWLVVATKHRDSDCLTRSNFRCMVAALAGKENKHAGAKGSTALCDTVAIEEASHWAVGWIQYLVIDPADIEKVKQAEQLLAKLEDYPVLNEEDWSELETEEANEVWKNCYRPKERITYIREHRDQFEFHDIADLLSCVRGKYFAGYASELI
jgi:hypothetical protein